MKAGLTEYRYRVLEDFFRRRNSEEDTYAGAGGYRNRKGDAEIDITVIDSTGKKARLIEVKRNRSKLNMRDPECKGTLIGHELEGYGVSYEGLSSEDVGRDA